MKDLFPDIDFGNGALKIKLLKEYMNAEVLFARRKNEFDVIKSLSEFNPNAVIVQWPLVKTRASSLGLSLWCTFLQRDAEVRSGKWARASNVTGW